MNKRHKWNGKINSKGGIDSSSVVCINCGCVKQWVGDYPTYFINDSVFSKAPPCKNTSKMEDQLFLYLDGKLEYLNNCLFWIGEFKRGKEDKTRLLKTLNAIRQHCDEIETYINKSEKSHFT